MAKLQEFFYQNIHLTTTLTGSERATMSVRVPPYLLSLIDWDEPLGDPLRLRDPARYAAGAEHLERVEQHDPAAELFERERRRRVQPRRRPPRGREGGRRRHQKSPSFT